MSVQPIRDFIVVTKDSGPEKTPSGIYIGHTEAEKNVTGTVVAVGSGRVTMNGSVVPLDVAVADKVVFNKNHATEVKEGEAAFWVLREDQVICILR